MVNANNVFCTLKMVRWLIDLNQLSKGQYRARLWLPLIKQRNPFLASEFHKMIPSCVYLHAFTGVYNDELGSSRYTCVLSVQLRDAALFRVTYNRCCCQHSIAAQYVNNMNLLPIISRGFTLPLGSVIFYLRVSNFASPDTASHCQDAR